MSNRILKANFADIADINSKHALVFPEVDPIIRDILSRDTLIRSRIKARPEGLETFRWVEQTGMARNAAFSDPRSIAPTATNYPTRVEMLAKLKCITSRITYNFFDTALTKNGTFSYILEQDMRDALADCLGVSNTAIYSGTDTSYGTPTTLQYMGLMTAITNTATFDTDTLLTQQIKTQVATMMNKKFGVARAKPTALYMNPMTADIIDKEIDNKDNNIKVYTVELTPGTIVPGIMTTAGILPIIRDSEVPYSANSTDSTKYDHKILFLNEDLIVRHYFVSDGVSYGDPVVFKLGRVESLVDDYVIFMADNVVVEYPDVAHCIATYTA
jgi:hypothetical protein